MNEAVEKAGERAENLLSLTTRLIGAVESDIAALQSGKYPPMALADPVIEQMATVYTREVAAARNAGVKNAPASMLRSLKDAAAKLKTVLKSHEHLVNAMRAASEGMVRSVAEEVDRMRSATMPYAAVPVKRPSAASVVYNKVI